MLKTSDHIDKLAAALVKAQSVMRGAKKDSENKHFKANYASLESVIDTARGPLNDNGLAFVQGPGDLSGNVLAVTTMLVHASGQWVSSTVSVPVQQMNPQGIGSAITYACRYSLMAMLGLPPVDDDAEAAHGRTAPAKTAHAKATPDPAPAKTAKPAAPKAEGLTDYDTAAKAEAADLYLHTARFAMRKCLTKESLRGWWRDEAANRASLLTHDDAQVLRGEMVELAATMAEN
jgi:hypothetical protein